MANSTPAGLVIMYDNGAGTPVDITQYVQSINDVDVEGIEEESHSFGDAWEEHLAVGVGRMAPIELSGLYDDITDVGPNALFAGRIPEGPGTATRTLAITWRGTKITSVETILASYRRQPDKGGLTKYTVRLIPTGTVTEA